MRLAIFGSRAQLGEVPCSGGAAEFGLQDFLVPFGQVTPAGAESTEPRRLSTPAGTIGRQLGRMPEQLVDLLVTELVDQHEELLLLGHTHSVPQRGVVPP